MIEVTNHEIIRDNSGLIKHLLIDVTYTDAIANKSAIWKLSITPEDFGGVMPTKAQVRAKIKERLTIAPSWQETLEDGTIVTITGKSALQRMKEEIQNRNVVKRFEKGEAGSLVNEIIPEN